jgi:hypothetical protein
MAAKPQTQGKAGSKGGAAPLKWSKAPDQGELKMWEPKAKGDTLEGPIASITKGKYGNIIKVKDGKKGILALKNHSFLVNTLLRIEEQDGAPLVAGDHVRVIFTGMVDTDNGKAYTYDVEYARTQAPF